MVANREERAEKSGAFVIVSPITVIRPVNLSMIYFCDALFRLTVVFGV
jgi:hypothetical protein